MLYDDFVNDMVDKAGFENNKYGWYLFLTNISHMPYLNVSQVIA